MGESWRLWYPKRPWLMNGDKQLHHMTRASRIAEWKEAFWLLALEAKVPRNLGHISIEVFHHYRSAEPDPGACMPAVKAAIDGLVKAQIVADDKGAFVSPITFQAPLKGPKDGLEIIVYSGGVNEENTAIGPIDPLRGRRSTSLRAGRDTKAKVPA